MTGALGPVGEVRADLVIDSRGTEQELRRELDDLGDDLDNDFEDIGEQWGDAATRGMTRQMGKSGDRLSDALHSAMDGREIRPNMTVEFDSEGNVRRTWVRFADALERTARSEAAKSGGGIFSKVGTALADAIGSGFNVSGKSPLIGLLVFLVGFIVELVLGAIQALQGLIALVTIIPGLIGAIAIQAGIVALAFDGMGTAIEEAFAANNAWELNEALKNLQPSAQKFVRELLPLEDIGKNLKKLFQESFFRGFNAIFVLDEKGANSPLKAMINTINSLDKGKLTALSEALGSLFGGIVAITGSKTFQKFIDALLTPTTDWLYDFGHALPILIKGFLDLGIAAMPFFSWLGEELNEELVKFGQWLTRISEDGSLAEWLEEMKLTLTGLWKVAGSFMKIIFAIFYRLDEAGGAKIFGEIVEQLDRLLLILDSPIGTKAFEGLIHTAVTLSAMFFGLIIIILLVLAAIEKVAEYIRYSLLGDIGTFFEWLGSKIMAFMETVGAAISGAFWKIANGIGEAISWPIRVLQEFAAWIISLFWNIAAQVGNAFWNVPNMIWNMLSSLPGMLWSIGRSALASLASGILSAVPSLWSAMTYIAAVISMFLPHSPAEVGPLSGSGDPMVAGATIVDRLAMGMTMEAPALASASNSAMGQIVFGAGALQMNFYGANPTAADAARMGAAAGNGVTGVLARRDTGLAIRAMA